VPIFAGRFLPLFLLRELQSVLSFVIYPSLINAYHIEGVVFLESCLGVALAEQQLATIDSSTTRAHVLCGTSCGGLCSGGVSLLSECK
jgi:hypothetical protein